MSPDTEPGDERAVSEPRPPVATVLPAEMGAERLSGFAATLAGLAASHADSAGHPWAGREFADNPFAADDGAASPALMNILAAFRAGEVGAEAVVDTVRAVRLLIPLVAEVGEQGAGGAGLMIDKTQELSIVSVSAPDGRRVLPVFSSVTAMRAWNPVARPVPAAGPRVALAAVSEGTELLVLDPTSDTEFVLRRPAVWALAQGKPWTPADRDPMIVAAFRCAIDSEPGVHEGELVAGDPEYRFAGEEVVVRLTLAAGLTSDELNTVLARLTQRLAGDDVIVAGVDSLRVQLVAAVC